jgi:hypothetical protein
VHVTIDEARQYQIAADIVDRYAVRQRRRRVLANGCDTSVSDPDIDETPVGEAAVDQECVDCYGSFLAEVSVGKPSSSRRRNEPAR